MILGTKLNVQSFWPGEFRVAHGIIVKCGLWTFHELWKKHNIFDFIEFWLAY